MTQYSLQSRDRIFVKGYGFCLLLKIWGEILVKRKVKTKAVNIITNEEEIPRERYISPNERQKIIGNLRLT